MDERARYDFVEPFERSPLISPLERVIGSRGRLNAEGRIRTCVHPVDARPSGPCILRRVFPSLTTSAYMEPSLSSSLIMPPRRFRLWPQLLSMPADIVHCALGVGWHSFLRWRRSDSNGLCSEALRGRDRFGLHERVPLFPALVLSSPYCMTPPGGSQSSPSGSCENIWPARVTLRMGFSYSWPRRSVIYI